MDVAEELWVGCRALIALVLVCGLGCASAPERPEPDRGRAEAELRRGRELLAQAKGPADVEARALPALRRSVEADPSLAEAWFELAWAYEELQRIADAVDAHRAGLALTPQDPRRLLGLADLLASGVSPRAQGEEAQSLYERAASAPAGGVFARIAQARLLTQEGRTLAQAVAAARQATTEAAEEWLAWDALGRGLLRQGEAGALEACERAVELSKGRPSALLGLAWALHRSGEEEGALEVVNELLQLREADRQALTLKGAIDRELGRAERARRSLDRAAALDPDDPAPLLARGVLLLSSSQNEALLDLREAVRLEPSDEELARALPKDLPRAARQALADAFAERGQTLEGAGDEPRALRAFDRAFGYEASPSHAYRAARVASADGDVDAALLWLERGFEVGLRDWRKLRLDEGLRSLRSDPRFGAILRRMGAPEDAPRDEGS